MFTILWKRKAQKQLLKISKTETKEAIATAVEKLTQFPNIQQAILRTDLRKICRKSQV